MREIFIADKSRYVRRIDRAPIPPAVRLSFYLCGSRKLGRETRDLHSVTALNKHDNATAVARSSPEDNVTDRLVGSDDGLAKASWFDCIAQGGIARRRQMESDHRSGSSSDGLLSARARRRLKGLIKSQCSHLFLPVASFRGARPRERSFLLFSSRTHFLLGRCRRGAVQLRSNAR